jgi:hypothetical protein
MNPYLPINKLGIQASFKEHVDFVRPLTNSLKLTWREGENLCW